MELSNRLKGIADMVTEGNRVADIGCDHGYVSIYLIENNKAPNVIAMDVNVGPLDRAREHIAKNEMLDVIDLRISDGIKALKILETEDKTAYLEVETLLIAGMGGRLIQKILLDSMEKVRLAKELILQPQSEIDKVRKFLRDYGFMIVEENMIYEDGKYYPMMRVVRNDDVGAMVEEIALYDKYGYCLLHQKNAVLFQFLNHEKKKLKQIIESLEEASNLSETTVARLRELNRELSFVNRALSYFPS